MAPHLLRHPRVRIRVLAEREHLLLAEEAVAAGDGKGHHDAVAYLQLLHIRPDLDDFAHELVPHDVARLHGGDESVVKVQVGAADRVSVILTMASVC